MHCLQKVIWATNFGGQVLKQHKTMAVIWMMPKRVAYVQPMQQIG